MRLREYQNEAVHDLRQAIRGGDRRLVLCAPTGSGKTAIFSFLVAAHLKRGGTVLIITNRYTLLTQAGGALADLKLSPRYIAPGKRFNEDHPLHCGMIETLSRRKEKYKEFLNSRSLVIIDECHGSAFDKIMPCFNPSAVVIGVTATPLRTGSQDSLDTYYQGIVTASDTPDLLAQGYLSRAISYGVDINLSGIKKKAGEFDKDMVAQRYAESKTYDGVIENYSRICPGKKAILFASNIASGEDICSRLITAGYPAQQINYKMSKADQAAILTWFAATPNGILCNVGILTAGYDCPDIKCVILYRATTSLILFLQMVGRGSRIAPDKNSFYILDFGNNIKTHGFWQEPRTWSLEKKPKKNKGLAPIRECEKCGALIPARAVKCEWCGHVRAMTEKEEEEKQVAELSLLPYREIEKKITEGITVRDLEAIRKAKGYKVGWLTRQLDRNQLEQYRKLKGYAPGWVNHQRIREEAAT